MPALWLKFGTTPLSGFGLSKLLKESSRWPEAPFAPGWYLHPTLVVSDVGIACISRRSTGVELVYPLGRSSRESSSSRGSLFNVANMSAADHSCARSNMVAELHQIQSEGIPAPQTPDAAFPAGRPPYARQPDLDDAGNPRRVPTNVRLLFPLLAPLLDESENQQPQGDMEVDSEASSSSSSSSSSSNSGSCLLQRKAAIITKTPALAEPPSQPKGSPLQPFRVSLAAALLDSPGLPNDHLQATCTAREIIAALTAGTPFMPAYACVDGLDLPLRTRQALAHTRPPWPFGSALRI